MAAETKDELKPSSSSSGTSSKSSHGNELLRAKYSSLPPLETDYGRPDGVDGCLLDPQHTAAITTEDEYKARVASEDALAKRIHGVVGDKPYVGTSEQPAWPFVLTRDGSTDWSESSVRTILGVSPHAFCDIGPSDEDTNANFVKAVTTLGLHASAHDIVLAWNEDQEDTDVVYLSVATTPQGSWVGFIQKVTVSDVAGDVTSPTAVAEDVDDGDD